MVIQCLGNGGFRLQNGEAVLIVDPPSGRFKANVILRTIVPTDGFFSRDEISFAGEYEVGGMEIHGWQVNGESGTKFIKTVYAVKWEEIRLVFLGHLSRSLPAEVLEELGEADVVFVPTGDDNVLPPAEAVKLLKQISPAVIIPTDQRRAAGLVKALGLKPEEADKLVFRRKDLGGEKMRLVFLKNQAADEDEG